MEVRAVAPCAECGAQPEELEHLREGRHTYQVMRVLGGFDTAWARVTNRGPSIPPEEQPRDEAIRHALPPCVRFSLILCW
jgi:hypothetical protein